MPPQHQDPTEQASRRFKKTVEDFVCYNCGTKVSGNGYTDHCPVCLWGKHVDTMPGDRSAGCHGHMRPIGAAYKSGTYTIYYECEGCGRRSGFKAAGADDADVLASLVSAQRRRKI